MVPDTKGSHIPAEKLRCLIVVTHYCPLVGGAQTVYDALARCFPKQFHVLTSRRDYITGEIVDGYGEFDSAAPYKITRTDRIRLGLQVGKPNLLKKIISAATGWWLNKKLMSRIKIICRTENIDTICVGANEALMWLPPALKRQADQQVIVFTHGEEISQTAHSTKAEHNRHRALHAADGIIAVSNYTAELLTQNYDIAKEKIYVSTNGVDLQKFCGNVAETAREALAFPQGPTVFSCGRLVARKGFDNLVEAWLGIVKAIPDAMLLIGGTGPLEMPLKQKVRDLGLEDNIQFLGAIKSEDMPSYYGLSSVFCMPNRTMPDGDTEGFGLVFLEASAMGTPSVAGRAGGTSDAVVDGETGLLVDGEDITEIQNAILTMLTNDASRNVMSAAALEFARSRGWPKKAAGIIDFMTTGDTKA